MTEMIQLRRLYDARLEIYHFRNLERSFPGHFHEDLLLGCLLKGERKMILPHIRMGIGPGDLVYLPPYTPHSCESVSRTGETVEWLCIHAHCPEGLTLPTRSAIIHDVNLASRLPSMAKESIPARLVGQLSALLWEITSRVDFKTTTEGDFCNAGTWGGKCNLAEMAARKRMDKFQFLRYFRKNTGLTPGCYNASLRVIQAKSFIRAGATLAEAAQGFCDQSHLNRVFKRQMGVTPGQWRDAREDWQ